jgi:predicted MFS family arabinose efflux permease
VAVAAVGLLTTFAPADHREQRRFDLVGAGILATTLAMLAWALGRIGAGEPAPERVASSLLTVIAIGAAGAGLALYAVWETISKHPMTPPYLLNNRPFVGLNVATVMVYVGVAIMFFLLPFDLIDRRLLSSVGAALVFLPFTLGMALLSPVFGNLADAIGPRHLLIIGPLGAALAYIWLALGHNASLVLGVVGPMTLLGISFAVLVAPLTASILSSVGSADEGLASGINNAVARIAQLIGVALAAGAASFALGYEICFASAAVISIGAATTAAATLPATAAE